MFTRGLTHGRLVAGAVFFLTFVSAASEAYNRYGPFPVRTQNPLYLLFLGMRPERPETLEAGSYDVSLDSSYSSLFQQHSVGGSAVDLDMEIWRLSPVVKYGLTDDLEVGLEIPMLRLGGGFLDSSVQSYHNAFGFPNAGRDTVPNGRFSYKVTTNGSTLYEVGPRPLGLSDLILDAKYRFLKDEEDTPTVALQAMFKPPTGNRSQGLGSGTPDGGLFLLAEDGWRWLGVNAEIGMLFLGGAKPLESISQSTSFAWMTGVEFTMARWISALIQVNGNTAVFHGTGLTQLDKAPLDLTLGFKGEQNQWIWQLGFTEDPKADDPAVDFTIFMSLGFRPATLKL